ncbi:DUF5685 family protein [Eubacteriales bacterium OttesenSCG-928-G02]|nr:DUF5685 family protein [Eubacteriales bacterium OttesenSCG-928-G02]
MFGYIRPQESELLVKEYELYKSVYCGLCVVGGKRISRLTRFLLNYDFVFLCLVRMSVKGEVFTVEKKRCPYNLKKKNMATENESMIYTCATFAILLYYKLIDDINDSKGIKKFFKKIAKPFFKRIKNKAVRLYPDLEEKIKNPLEELTLLEKENCNSIDKTADTFARITAAIASESTENRTQEILYECGYHVGRYIYLIDAYEDCKNDAESNSYNVFNLYYGSMQGTIASTDKIKLTLNDSILAFCRAYEKSEKNCFNNLIYNIIQLGSKNAFSKAEQNLKGIE